MAKLPKITNVADWVAAQEWHRNCDCVEIDGVKSLPASECDWPGHQEAVDEAGFCPVCQH